MAGGTNYLFGAEGRDRALRIVAMRDFTADRAAKGLATSGPEYDRSLRAYVVSKLGEPVMANRGIVFGNRFSEQAMPFAGYHMAGFRTGLGGLSGDVGLTNPSVMQRIAAMAKGPIGGLARAAGAGIALSGHLPQRTGIPLPLYSTPEGEKFYRGSLAGADSALGSRAKEEYLVDPATGPIERTIAAGLYANKDAGLSDTRRQMVNDATGFLGPAATAGITAFTGTRPYQSADGTFADAGSPHVQKNRSLKDYALDAAQGVTAAGALMPSGQGQPPALWRRFTPFLAQQSIGAPAALERHNTTQFVSDVSQRIIGARDTTTAKEIGARALKEMAAHGLDTSVASGVFLRALYGGRAKTEAGVAQARFEAQYGTSGQGTP
jgi:hypothetical protein